MIDPSATPSSEPPRPSAASALPRACGMLLAGALLALSANACAQPGDAKSTAKEPDKDVKDGADAKDSANAEDGKDSAAEAPKTTTPEPEPEPEPEPDPPPEPPPAT